MTTAATLFRARNSERFWTESECRELIAQSFALRFRDPRGMLDLAEAAAHSAERVWERGHRCCTAALLAEAKASLANARKVCGDYPGAESELAASSVFEAQAGANRVVLEARRYELLGSLRCRQGRYPEAREALLRSLALQPAVGDRMREVSFLVQLALIENEDRKPAAALSLLGKANRLTSVLHDPLMAVASRHSTVKSFLGLGLVSKARAALEGLAPLYRLAGDLGVELRGRWVQAEIWAAAGEPSADMLYRQVLSDYSEMGSPYESAKVALELCILYADRCRFDEVEEVAAIVRRLFLALGIEREARMAELLAEALGAQERAAAILRAAARLLDREPIGGRALRR